MQAYPTFSNNNDFVEPDEKMFSDNEQIKKRKEELKIRLNELKN